MIRELNIDEVMADFFSLMVEVEFLGDFDSTNVEHGAWLERKIRRRFGAGARFFGLFGEDGRSMGLCSLIIDDHPEMAGHSELVDLGVYEEFRRKGHASSLIAYAEDLSRGAKLHCMYIATYAAEAESVAFYGKRGFAPVATLPGLNGPENEGQVYMRKIL